MDNQHYEREFEILSREQSRKYWERKEQDQPEDLVYRLRTRASIRKQIPDRKSVQEGKEDRIASLLEEAANEIERLREMDKKEYVEVNAISPVQVLSEAVDLVVLADKVFTWGVARNITAEGGATALSQIKKLKEEVQEIEDGLLSKDEAEIKDGIGDTLVVLLQICRLSGFDLVDCLNGAWNEIKDRKGHMENGVFIKEVK